MANKYLDGTGLALVWEKVKNIINGKVDKVDGKGLSSNDFTSVEKTKLATVESGAQANVLEGIQKNGVTVSPTNKIANIIVPTKVSDVTNDAGFITLSDLSIGSANGICPLNASTKIDSAYLPSYVDDVIEAYPRTGQTPLSATWLAIGSASGTVITPESGVIYILMADSGDYDANTQFRWGGSAYVKMGDGGVSALTETEINAILNQST